MKVSITRTLQILLGILLIVIGIVGLILPVLNGIVFLLLGLIIISFEHPYVEHALNKYAHKNKKVGEWYEKLDMWLRKVFRKPPK
jgi:uncharacterized membrane protein YbaN (DUF454 family)